MNTDFDVVIIGGGAAGIGAARHLAASGRSTLLMEATSRLGGRAWTYEIAGHRLDLGCGWLHSGDRNAWAHIAEAAGLVVDRRAAKWGVQHRHLGFSPGEQKAAGAAFDAWLERVSAAPPSSDCAADALPPGGEWNGYLEAISGFISGARLERISVTDYLAYDSASTRTNWRAPHGYGDLIVASLRFQHARAVLQLPQLRRVLDRAGVRRPGGQDRPTLRDREVGVREHFARMMERGRPGEPIRRRRRALEQNSVLHRLNAALFVSRPAQGRPGSTGRATTGPALSGPPIATSSAEQHGYELPGRRDPARAARWVCADRLTRREARRLGGRVPRRAPPACDRARDPAPQLSHPS